MRSYITSAENRQRFAMGLISSTCLVTFQAYLVAPLTASLAKELGSTNFAMGFSIPAFAIPFGIGSFLCSLLIEEVDRRKYLSILLTGVAIGLVLLSMTVNGTYFLIMRALTGILCGGVLQVSMSVMNDMFQPAEREKATGRLVLALATGMTLGPTFGACLYPLIGWRWQFILLAFWPLLILIYSSGNRLGFYVPTQKASRWKWIMKTCKLLVLGREGRKMYSFIYLDGIFHSGLFVWISYYFGTHYQLNNQGTGLMLLLFSLPGLLMAVSIGVAVKKYGITRVVFAGVFTVTLTLIILMLNIAFWTMLLAVGTLSLGYVLTQPFYAGIINSIRRRNGRNIASGLGFGILFLGYGTGPVIFQYLLGFGIMPALIALVIVEILLASICIGPVINFFRLGAQTDYSHPIISGQKCSNDN